MRNRKPSNNATFLLDEANHHFLHLYVLTLISTIFTSITKIQNITILKRELGNDGSTGLVNLPEEVSSHFALVNLFHIVSCSKDITILIISKDLHIYICFCLGSKWKPGLLKSLRFSLHLNFSDYILMENEAQENKWVPVRTSNSKW